MWGSRLLREGLILLAISLAFAAFARILRKPDPVAVLTLALALGGLYYVRGTAALILAVALVLVLAILTVSRHGRLSPRLQIALAVAAPAAFVALQLGASHFEWDLEQANYTLTYTNRDADSTIFGDDVATVSSPQQAMVRAVTVLPTALLGPLPWQMTTSAVGLLSLSSGVPVGAGLFCGARWSVPQAARGRCCVSSRRSSSSPPHPHHRGLRHPRAL